MNLFIEGPGHKHHMVTCEGCGGNFFLKDMKHHSGSHWCKHCHGQGKHLHSGMGFGPMRFTKHDNSGSNVY